jgi:hypothetical protein
MAILSAVKRGRGCGDAAIDPPREGLFDRQAGCMTGIVRRASAGIGAAEPGRMPRYL